MVLNVLVVGQLTLFQVKEKLMQSENILFQATIALILKLDGVGLVDNRPSTDNLHHFVQKK